MKKIFTIIATAVVLLAAKNTQTEEKQKVQTFDAKPLQVTVPKAVPFIDKDGDGIHDLFQYEWKEKKQFKKHFNQQHHAAVLTPDVLRKMIGSDDGSSIQSVIETGVNFKSFDLDGDGKPDQEMLEAIHQYMQQMRQWRLQKIRLLYDGTEAFVDENGDGFPDDMPQHWMQFRNCMNHEKSTQNEKESP